jgi:CelD/BcsL family acetyltransferase involved in cellulose biosynthesis
MVMKVVRFTTMEELIPFAGDWDRLSAGVPFRSWAWMSTWWRHYGQDPRGRREANSLYVLGVFDSAGRLVGIAPWYLERSILWGRTLKFLGTGEVCSEYLTVLADPSAEDRVTEALAQWLTDAARAPKGCSPAADRWDRLELTSVDANDSAIRRLTEALRTRGNLVHQRPGPCCWRIDLPESWDQYLAMLSRNGRSQLRKTERRLVQTGRAVFHLVEREADLPRGIEILIDLHQRRRRTLGEPGCFASPRFTAFHREVMPKLLRARRLHLFWLELDGTPLVAEYFLLGGDTTYSYQSGLDPNRLKDCPGWLGNIAGVKHAVARGHRAFDFLRGDEPYKADFAAQPRHMVETRVAAARLGARLRWNLWLLGGRAKRWAKTVLRRARQAAAQPTDQQRDAPGEEALSAGADRPELVGSADGR